MFFSQNRVEIALQQNEIMNVFFDDWKALAEDQEEGKPGVYLKEYQLFTDVQYLKNRTISCVRWHPTIYGNAFNSTDLSFQWWVLCDTYKICIFHKIISFQI